MSKTISSSSVQDIVHAFELTGHSVYYNMEESNDKETYTVRNNETDKIVMSIEKLVGSPLAHLIDLVNCDPYRITYHEVEKEEVMWQYLIMDGSIYVVHVEERHMMNLDALVLK